MKGSSVTGSESRYLYGHGGVQNSVRSRTDTDKAIKIINAVWDPLKPFAQVMEEKGFRSGKRWIAYPTDDIVLMTIESVYKKDNTQTDVVEIQLMFGDPHAVRSQNYRRCFLKRLKILLRRNPQVRIIEILASAVMGQGYFSYLSDQEFLGRLIAKN